jgi:hypothetical protein
MKYKTTRKDVMQGYWKVIEVGDCDLQHLLSFLSPVAYTCGIYGWNSDIYQMPFNGNICICTGYRPFGNVHPDYSVIHRYNELAKSCKTNDEQMELLRWFVAEATAEKKKGAVFEDGRIAARK